MKPGDHIHKPVAGNYIIASATSVSKALAILFLAVIGSFAAQQCADISSIDFRNSTITTKPAVGVEEMQFRFRGGVFDELEQPGGRVDWHFEIVQDKILRPNAQTMIRFIQISGDHRRGTGSRNYLIGYRCSGGLVNNVFQQAGEGMRVISLSPQSLQLGFDVWKDTDAHCCPSLEKKVWFSWDGALGSYVETRFKKTSRLSGSD